MANDDSKLLKTIVNEIKEKKGIDIVEMNLSKLENSIADYFVICHGNSNTQVDAIANFVERKVKEELNEKAWHFEGKNNAQWILIDFSSVIVHVFQKEYRDFYDLEGLWADSETKHIDDK